MKSFFASLYVFTEKSLHYPIKAKITTLQIFKGLAAKMHTHPNAIEKLCVELVAKKSHGDLFEFNTLTLNDQPSSLKAEQIAPSFSTQVPSSFL